MRQVRPATVRGEGLRLKLSRQPMLFAPPRQRVRRTRVGVYGAVMTLRQRGLMVYRAGREHHIVNGRRMTTAALIEMAKRGPR